MCRMFSVLSSEPVSASKYLRESDCSLYELAEKGNQGDGWGIGYYLNGRLEVYKSEKAIYDDTDFDRVAAAIRSSLFIAHVRKASNPRSLPREKLISKASSQPFYYSNLLFVHNGTLFMPDEVLGTVGEKREVVQGVNDSEVLFAYLLRNISVYGGVDRAFRELEPRLQDVHRKCGSPGQAPYRGLNIMFSDGKRLYAYEKYIGDSGPSICHSTPVFELQYLLTDTELVVSSEALTADRWEPIPNGALMKAEIINGRPTLDVKVLG